MVDYQRMGNGGTRPATVTLNNHALVYFKEFLQSKDIVFLVDKRNTRLALWEEQERRLCCKEIWQEYGTFLRDNAKQSNGNFLSTGTALNYLGQPKETVRKMYENHVLLNEHELKQGQKLDSLGSGRFWFSRIRNQLQKDMNHKHILLGDSLSESALPLGRKCVSEINRLHLSQGLVDNIEKPDEQSYS